MIYSYCGKQVLLDNRDFAQAKSIDAAELIADLLNADQQRRESRGSWSMVDLDRASAGEPLKIKGHVCRAYQASDQMLCPCGLQWDVNDSDPPACNVG